MLTGMSAMGALNMPSISRIAIVVAGLLEIGMIVTVSIFISLGLSAKSDITDALVKEQVMTSKDAPIPGVEVTDAATAGAQQEAIE